MDFVGCDKLKEEDIYKKLNQKVGMPYLKFTNLHWKVKFKSFMVEIGRVFTRVIVKSFMDEELLMSV